MADPRPITISSHPNLDPDAVAGRQFPVAWRGYDQESVHRFLVDVGQLLKQLRANQRELTERLADAERRAAEPELDEETLSAALGSETTASSTSRMPRRTRSFRGRRRGRPTSSPRRRRRPTSSGVVARPKPPRSSARRGARRTR